MKLSDKETTKLPTKAKFAICLGCVVIGFGFIMGIVAAIRWTISFVQDPSGTWSTTWADTISSLKEELGILIMTLTYVFLVIVGWTIVQGNVATKLCRSLFNRGTEKDKNFSKVQQSLGVLIQIALFIMLVVSLGFLYGYVSRFLHWLGLFAPES